jgi:excisionase family DNA binding protein
MSSKFVEIRKICEWCGKEFIAKKQSTRYCTHICNSRAYKANSRVKTKIRIEQQTDDIIKNKPIADFKDREFLKCAQAAKLLGVCNQTVYNLIYSKKLKAVRISSRMTIIQRKDIDALINISLPCEPNQISETKPITEFYSLNDIITKYGVKTRRIWDIIKMKNIPTIKQGRNTLISKKHIDNHFKKNPPRNKAIL